MDLLEDAASAHKFPLGFEKLVNQSMPRTQSYQASLCPPYRSSFIPLKLLESIHFKTKNNDLHYRF